MNVLRELHDDFMTRDDVIVRVADVGERNPDKLSLIAICQNTDKLPLVIHGVYIVV